MNAVAPLSSERNSVKTQRDAPATSCLSLPKIFLISTAQSIWLKTALNSGQGPISRLVSHIVLLCKWTAEIPPPGRGPYHDVPEFRWIPGRIHEQIKFVP
jgi:hypothetical protein